ncbi:MAG: wax ester/triacylglycerol synthase family O-acyltransferase [Anaerolineales bacterium]|nr:wax ester/triacylglycerol synthase family O-acyltransferase [Anaerolineales bacterium]
MKALSGIDASFLYIETPNMPMHVGGVAVYEDTLTFETFRQTLVARMPLIPKLRQRLVQVPLSLDRPYWLDDPDFHLEWHLHHTSLPHPGGWRQLRHLASRLFSQPLDRSRPLWEMIFVEGLDDVPLVKAGSVAIISKIHHAVIDGVSGTDFLGLLLDISPEPRKLPEAKPHNPDPIPSDIGLVLRSARNFFVRPLKLPRLLAETAKATLKAGYLTRIEGIHLPPIPFSAPRTRFNAPISKQRIWNSAILSLDRVKVLRKSVEGATVNDVVLAICAGALRRYLAEKDELPEKPLVAMVPISTRLKEEKNKMGNQVSAMLVQLATEEADPLTRFQQIVSHTQEAKSYQRAVDARELVNYSELVPFGLAGLAARLYSRMQAAARHRPIFNLVITNVPGPQIPLYMAGARLLNNMSMAPVADGLGLILTIFSYNGLLSISPMACPQLMPDLDQFTRYLWESANELETAVQAEVAASEKAKPAPEENEVAAALPVQQCQGLTKAGTQCRNHPQNGYQYCHLHLPAAKAEMKV